MISTASPVVRLTMTDAAYVAIDRQARIAHGAVVRMSLPYVLRRGAARQTVRAVRFDTTTGKWTDAGLRTTTVGPHSVTALLSGPGLFTVLAVERATTPWPSTKTSTP